MTLIHIYTLKDSKKSSFAILRFFYNLLWFSKVLAIKEKQICNEDPELSQKQIPVKRPSSHYSHES